MKNKVNLVFLIKPIYINYVSALDSFEFNKNLSLYINWNEFIVTIV